MPGVFSQGQLKIIPGVYIRSTSDSITDVPARTGGIVAVLAQTLWGPLGSTRLLSSIGQVDTYYGSGSASDALRQAFVGGAERVLALRVGDTSEGVVATRTMVDTTGSPVNVVRIDAVHKGTRGNTFKLTIANSLTLAGKRELRVYEDTTLLETFIFTGGATEPANLIAAVAAGSGLWITAVSLAAGNGIMAAVSAVSMASGADPSVVAGDYTNALSVIESERWGILATDSEDDAIHATIGAFVDRVVDEGKRVIGVVGEPTSVSLSDRKTNAAVLNSENVSYVGNGFVDSNEEELEGYLAVARYAGMIAGTPLRESTTNSVVLGATAVVNATGELTNSELEECLQAGMVVFALNTNQKPKVLSGINTLTSLDANQDVGWKKERRVRIRYDLMNRIDVAWEPLLGKVGNTDKGQDTLMVRARGVVLDMVREDLLFPESYVELDPDNPSTADTIYVRGVIWDVDSIEFAYVTFKFQANPPS